MRSRFLLTVSALAACLGLIQDTKAVTLSQDKPYAYFLNVPGVPANFYLDTPHAVNTLGLGVYSTGDLTDGVLQPAAGITNNPSPAIAMYRPLAEGGAPAVEIIFDLGQVSTVQDIVIGAVSRNCCASGGDLPSGVNISFSAATDAAADFGAATNFSLWAVNFLPGANSGSSVRDDMTLSIGGESARYVKVAFEGITSRDRYFLDEIAINGDAPPPPANLLNLSEGKSYAYYQTVPGQAPYYNDDPHAVNTGGLGVFSAGDLTDGVVGTGSTDADLPASPVVAIYGGAGAVPVPVDIVFDLEDVYEIHSIVIGTSLRGNNGTFGNFAPDDVLIGFSTTGELPADFITLTQYALWATSDPLGLGHHEKTLTFGGELARYVLLSFNGQATEKYVLDEITINGIAPPVIPEPASLALMAMSGLVLFRRRRIARLA